MYGTSWEIWAILALEVITLVLAWFIARTELLRIGQMVSDLDEALSGILGTPIDDVIAASFNKEPVNPISAAIQELGASMLQGKIHEIQGRIMPPRDDSGQFSKE